MEKLLDWCLECHPPLSSNTPSESPSILEVGSGNGALLFALVEAGYPPTLLHGIDYSPDAIKLSQAIASVRGSGTEEIRFTLCDFLSQDPSPDSTFDGWDLVLDKGTFDAMALGDKDEDGHAPSARYPGRLVKLLKPGGRFMITCENCIPLLVDLDTQNGILRSM
jgi:EEF1A lysine methyltransferase 2